MKSKSVLYFDSEQDEDEDASLLSLVLVCSRYSSPNHGGLLANWKTRTRPDV